jgi:Integrase core domain
MASKPVAFLLADLGVTKSHSRPHTSNDNPYSESQFKTLKHRPEFPDRFGSIQDAHGFCTRFFGWYNTEHRHSGIGFQTPTDVHYGRAELVRAQRARVLEAAYAAHPSGSSVGLQRRPSCRRRRGSTSPRRTCPAQGIPNQPVSPRLTASEVVATGHGRVQGVGLLEVAHGGLQAQALDRGGLLGRAHQQGPDGRARLGEQPHQLPRGQRSSGVSTHIPAADASTCQGAGRVPCSTPPIPGATAGCSPNTHQHRSARPNDTGFPAMDCSRWPSTTGPNPGCGHELDGPGIAGWSAAPAGLDPIGNAATRPSTRSSRSAGRDRAAGAVPSAAPSPHHANTNTSTTTMISTHNHVDMAASLVGPGAVQADAPAAHSSKQLGHAARPPPDPGSTAALRAGLQDPGTLRPARRSGGWRGGCQPDPVPVKP